jgi:beta-lactamase regulating signal transducer with metallopeptidase domain
MNRTILIVAGVFSASSLLLVDSAVKGAALLMLAAVAAIILRRDSAATRHLVWLLAIVAMLAVPVLSAILPQWRVLPEWASIPPATAGVAIRPPTIAGPELGTVQVARNAEPEAVESPSASAYQPASALPDSHPALVTPKAVPASAVWSWNWRNALPLAWAIGFCVLILRLMAARWMLWNTERQGIFIWSPKQPAKATRDPIVMALEAVCMQLGICRPVSVLLHPEKTIPVVWGILRCRLLLPEAARQWSGEQLRSVLLHELAHIKRRDTLAQLLTQIACALHWFNPLAWFAAWRLGVERERACDDLVLASGVRPSAYAGHLLEVVTGLSPARWTQSCGLAMARKSSLNGRLFALLSEKVNRRGVTTALAAAALLLGVGIAVPLAMLRAAEPEKPKAEATAVNVEPKDPESRPLFESWKSSARTDGKIPGGRIGEVAASLKTFMGLNPGHEQSVKLEPVLKKCDASRDWTPAEAAALLDEIAAITPRAQWAMRTITERRIHPGKPLPDDLVNAPWGKPAANGLRIAWLLEPRTETHALATALKSRVFFHNTGKAPVCFATDDWIQTGAHKAKDANGKEIGVWAVEHTRMPLRMNFRLAPGEYAQVVGYGVHVGPHQTSTDNYNVGCWIGAKEGDTVTFTPGNVPVSFQTWHDNEGLKDSVTVWREMIAGRVMQESPMPAAPADREQLLRRVTKDLLGVEPTAEEVAAFAADNAPDALAKLTARLQTMAGPMHFAGELPGGTTQFSVTAAAPKKEEPKAGAMLKPATEQRLKWGAIVNGLQMALAWPPSLGEPGIGDAPSFYLVVQNVSQADVRLTANDAAPNPRRMIMWNNGTPMMATADPTPMPGDWLLQPRQVAFFRLFQPAEKMNDGRNISAADEQAVRVYPQYSLTAEMTIEKAPAGAWTGKLATSQSRGSMDVIPPKNKDAQALYKSWALASRIDGKIPGGVIGLLGQSVVTFIKGNPTWQTTPQLQKMLPRFDASRDWSGQDAVALLDELAAVQDTPIGMALGQEDLGLIRAGTPLPPDLADAPWGKALANGLRHAWLLEPRAAEHRLGTPLKARVLIHNAGKEPVVFRTRSWHQLAHTATDAKGAAIKVESTDWMTLGQLTLFRLEPGEFIEVNGPGIGVGANKNNDDWQNTNVGSWIEAKAGDDVTVTTAPLPLSDWNEKPEVDDGEPRWWHDHITARLSRHLPFPADADARLRLLHVVAIEVLGTSASKQMNDAFVADTSPTALASAAERLFHRPGLHAWAGPLESAPTKFRVLPADPDAAKKPRAASNPGHYILAENAELVVTRRPDDERIVNEASIRFGSPDPAKPALGNPHEIKLPDGYNTWAAAWMRGGTMLWVQQKSDLRSYDFTDPAQVKETSVEELADLEKVPKPIRDALRAEFDVPGAPKPATKTPRSAAEAPK